MDVMAERSSDRTSGSWSMVELPQREVTSSIWLRYWNYGGNLVIPLHQNCSWRFLPHFVVDYQVNKYTNLHLSEKITSRAEPHFHWKIFLNLYVVIPTHINFNKVLSEMVAPLGQISCFLLTSFSFSSFRMGFATKVLLAQRFQVTWTWPQETKTLSKSP